MYYQCFPTRGKARKDTNKSLISNLLCENKRLASRCEGAVCVDFFKKN